MLPTTLVTLATFLLELCSSSPVYNMQPAFIINTVGATNGRNIRNLPCISRKNNNQSGVCMFAIDCLKANGTHLGTCIDRFYFGSCCHIEPLHEIVDNSLDTDILPHREPPMRISSTTMKISTSTLKVQSTSLVSLINKSPSSTTSSTTQKVPIVTTTATKLVTKSSSPSTSVVFGERITTRGTTTIPVESTTLPQKLQTFQVVDGSSITETSTKPTTTSATTKVTSTTRLTTSRPLTTTSPSVLTTSEPVSTTTKPLSSTIASTTARSTTTRTATSKTTTEKHSVTKTTAKPRPTKTASTTSKPTRTTKPSVTKATSKPSKPTNKPIRSTTTRRPLLTTKVPSTTSKTTKPSNTTTKPFKTTTTTRSTTVKTTTAKLTTRRPTTTQASTTSEKSTTASPITTSTSITSELVEITLPTTKKPEVIPTRFPVLSSTLSNEIPLNRLNISSVPESVNGNPATNEIESSKPVITPKPQEEEKPTGKPGIVTWQFNDDSIRNGTTPSNESNLNVTTEGWVPMSTPDSWILLPNVSLNTTEIQESTVPAQTSSSTFSPERPLVSSISTADLPIVSTSAPLETSTNSTSSPLVEESFSTDSITSTINTTLSTPTNQSSTTETLEQTTTTEILDADDMTTTTKKPINMSDYTDVCGRRMHPKARIVGGEQSMFGKWPWQISLRQWRTSTYLHKCGAALLNENWAITAAHCVDNVPPSDLLLRLGEHDLSTEGEPYLHQERRVQIVASHPQFDPRTFEYDLALLRFYEPVTFQPNIVPVCVPQSDEDFIGRTAYVTGWGRLYEDGPLPSVLQEVSVPVINNSVCEQMYRSAGYIEHIPHIFICAGWRRGGFDSCEGDSGGPMVIQREDKRFLLAGIISWGIGCAEPNQPGVYTRISEFRDWINQILQF